MKKIIIALTTLMLLVVSAASVFAYETPNFPTCSNPQGELKVKYDSGIHGIVGDTGEYRGSDEVYTLTDTTLLQCFCADNGDGIRTDWWNVGSLAQDEINDLLNQGWQYVPSGSVWGLDSAPYLAKNSTYSCSDGTGGGEVLGSAASTSGSVLGLATTGNTVTLYGYVGFGLVSLLLGIIVRRSISKK